jgi:hypothetical protein
MISVYIKRNYTVFIFLFFSNLLLKSQVLLDHTPPLFFNPGGVVNCVAYDSTKNVYILGGEFTTVNSSPRLNLCFLDSASLSLKTVAPFVGLITSIDGPINALKIVGNRIFVGGSFTQINGQVRNGLAVFVYIPFTSSYILGSWAPLNSTCNLGMEKVTTFDYVNDTLFIGGSFLSFDCLDRYGFAAIKPSTLTNYTYGAMASFSGSWPEITKVEYYKHSIYLGGFDFKVTDLFGTSTTSAATFRNALCKLKPNGNIDLSFDPSWTTGGGAKTVHDMDVTEYGVYILKTSTGAGAKDFNRQSLVSGASLSINVNDPTNLPVFNSPHCLKFYKDKIYYGSSNPSAAPPSPHFGGRNILDQYPFWDANLAIPFNVGSVTLVQNRLFVSENSLTSPITISGDTINTLAVYCLEPYNASSFVIADSTICPGQNGVIFKVPPVPYAEKYHWFYTGAGANISGGGSSVILSGTFYNQVSIDFSAGLTGGKLCIVPMSSCNERADTLKVNITVNPVPNANAGVDKYLSCKDPEINVIGTSSSPSVSFEWTGPFSFSASNDTILVDTAGTYILTVTSLINGCTKTDNVLVGYDTVKPNVTLPLSPYVLTCNDSVITLTGSSTDPQTILNWRNVSTGNLFANPIIVNSPGQYMFIVIDTLNGCPDSLPLIVSLYQPIPNIKITGYTSIPTSSPIDTITCYNPYFDFIAYSDTASTVVYFTDTSQTLNYGDSIHVDSNGFYFLVAKNLTTGCENFIGFYVSQFTNVPDLILPVSPEINCSVDSTYLDAGTILTGTQLTWDGPSVSNLPDPITAYIPGYYVATNLDPLNGCFKTDSVLVSYVPEILVNAGNDTIVCNGTTFELTANYIGSFSGITYAWSNGDLDSVTTINASSGLSTIITISESGGCVGIDTVFSTIPNVPIDSIVSFKPCGNDSTGQIVVYLSNGLAPYIYSLDGISYQSLPQFNNLPVGTYNIYVKDSLGCDYLFSEIIDANSSLPQPFFLNSTYNSINDTIVLVDVSTPTPDSIQWIIPAVFNLIEDGSTAFIKSIDTGVFQITMRAFYSTCLIDTTKLIYIKQFDSLLANLINENGIKKLILYSNPNNGIFTVELEFYKKQDYSIGIYDVNSTSLFNNFTSQSFGNTYLIDISSAVNGTYILRVVSEFDSRSVNFIIQH